MNRMNEKRKRKKELIQHNVTYKKLKIKEREREREREREKTWLIAIRNFDIYIYILNDINVEIIKLMEIYTVFWNR